MSWVGGRPAAQYKKLSVREREAALTIVRFLRGVKRERYRVVRAVTDEKNPTFIGRKDKTAFTNVVTRPKTKWDKRTDNFMMNFVRMVVGPSWASVGRDKKTLISFCQFYLRQCNLQIKFDPRRFPVSLGGAMMKTVEVGQEKVRLLALMAGYTVPERSGGTTIRRQGLFSDAMNTAILDSLAGLEDRDPVELVYRTNGEGAFIGVLGYEDEFQMLGGGPFELLEGFDRWFMRYVDKLIHKRTGKSSKGQVIHILTRLGLLHCSKKRGHDQDWYRFFEKERNYFVPDVAFYLLYRVNQLDKEGNICGKQFVPLASRELMSAVTKAWKKDPEFQEVLEYEKDLVQQVLNDTQKMFHTFFEKTLPNHSRDVFTKFLQSIKDPGGKDLNAQRVAVMGLMSGAGIAFDAVPKTPRSELPNLKGISRTEGLLHRRFLWQLRLRGHLAMRTYPTTAGRVRNRIKALRAGKRRLSIKSVLTSKQAALVGSYAVKEWSPGYSADDVPDEQATKL